MRSRTSALTVLAGSAALFASFLVVTPPAQAAITCAGRIATIIGSDRSERINGTSGPDVIHGLGGNDVINGLGGNDIICGGEGSDDLRGQAGNDRLYGNLDGVRFEEIPMDWCSMDPGLTCMHAYVTGDILRGNAGQDLLVPGWDNREFDATMHRERDELRWDTAPRRVRVNLSRAVASGDGVDRIAAAGPVAVIGSDFDDVLVGTNDSDVLESGAGADTVHGRDGNDTIVAGSVGPGLVDVVHAGAGDDRVTGGGGSHELHGDEGNDVLTDASTIRIDRLYGGAGEDRLQDTLIVAAGQVVDGGPVEQFSLDTLRAEFVRMGGSVAWDMATGLMTFTEPESMSVMAIGIRKFFVENSMNANWNIQGTDLDESVSLTEANHGSTGTFSGLGGNDSFSGTPRDDFFDGGEGQDDYWLDGGGKNTCRSVEVPRGQCDVILP